MIPEAAANDPFDERFFYEVPQRFYHSFAGEVTASMLADSLLGIDGVVKHSVEFLEHYLDVKIRGVEAVVTSVELGSLDENFVFRFFFGKGRSGAKKFEQFREAIGVKNMDPKHLVGLAVSVVVLGGIGYWVKSGGQAPTQTSMENTFINISNGLQITPDELRELLQASIKDPEDLKRSTIKVVNPAGQRVPGSIILNGDEGTVIGPDLLSLVPESYEKPEEEEPMKDFPSAELSIRAMDLDKATKGWWALAPEISDRRLPILLGPGIDPLTIPYGKTIKADLTLTYKVDRHGNRTPKALMLKTLVKDASVAVAAE